MIDEIKIVKRCVKKTTHSANVSLENIKMRDKAREQAPSADDATPYVAGGILLLAAIAIGVCRFYSMFLEAILFS